LNHPAIQAYRKEARLHVPVTWRDTVIEVVGDIDEDILSWAELVRDWIGNGWNPRNVKGMTEAYKNGGIKKRPPKQVTSVVDDMRKEYT